MGLLTEDNLRRLTEAIVRACDPVVVILFGSQARGTVDDDSDVDLLIVEDEPFSAKRSRRREIARLRRTLPPVGLPVDILLFHSGEVARWKDSTNHVMADALRDGRTLHERS